MTSLLLLSCLLAHQSADAAAKAESAYEASQAKLRAARSISATVEVKNFDRTDVYELRFLKDNFGKIVSKDALLFQNGRTFYDYDVAFKEYYTKPAPAQGFPSGTAFSLGGLTGLESLVFPNEPELVPVKSSSVRWQGMAATAVTLQGKRDQAIRSVLYLDPSTSLPMGWDYSLRDFKASGRYRSIQLNTALRESDFAWAPPKGSKKIG